MKNIFIILICTGFCLCSCDFFAVPGNDILDGTEWDLVFIRKSFPVPGSKISLSFQGGEIHGTSGCNSYFGKYKILGTNITFSEIAMTEMACLDPEGVMQQEQDYLAFLSEIVSFSIDSNELILKKAKQDQLIFDIVAN